MRLRTGNGSVYFIVFGLVAAIAAAWWTWSAQQAVHRTVDVVVATRDVPPLQAIMPGDVAVMPVPIQAVPADALRDGAATVGRYVRFGLLSGQVVQSANLAAGPTGSSQTDAQLTAVAGGSADERAVTVPLQAETGLDLPQPGDHVDLLAVVKGQGSSQARVLASDVPVLDRFAIGAVSTGPSITGTGQPALQQGALVLELTVAQAQQVALAETTGSIQVLLDPLGLKISAAPPPLDAAQWFSSGGS